MHDTGLRLLSFIKDYTDREGRCPTQAEMQEAIDRSGNATVAYWLEKFEAAGYIERLGGARDVRILNMPAPEPDPLATAD